MAKEYIERGALKNDLIEFTPYAVSPLYRNLNSNIDMFTVIDVIDEQPVANVAEVVRCKDCKYWAGINKFGDGECGHLLGLHDVAQPGDFCSYGERRDCNKTD